MNSTALAQHFLARSALLGCFATTTTRRACARSASKGGTARCPEVLPRARAAHRKLPIVLCDDRSAPNQLNSLFSHDSSLYSGKKAEVAGFVLCKNCTAGYYVSGIGNTGCFTCNPGKYTHQSGMTACLPCAAGRFTSRSGESSRTCEGACTKGRYGSAGERRPECEASCAKGFYSLAAASSCTECPAGRYGGVRGLSDPGCSGPCTDTPAQSTSCSGSGSGQGGAVTTPSPTPSQATAPPTPSGGKGDSTGEGSGGAGDQAQGLSTPIFLLVAGAIFVGTTFAFAVIYLHSRSKQGVSLE